MHVSQADLNRMINNIPDANQRRILSDIITRRIVKKVYCLSDHCDGALVAYIYTDGKVQEESEKEGSGAMAFRWRLDGSLGIHCACGQNSILAEQEQHMQTFPPQKAELEQVYSNFQDKPNTYPVKDGRQIVDGFAFEETEGN